MFLFLEQETLKVNTVYYTVCTQDTFNVVYKSEAVGALTDIILELNVLSKIVLICSRN